MYQQLMQNFEDLLSYLETKTYDPAGKPNMPPYCLPSGATISAVCPQNLPQNELQDAIQVSFRHKRQVVDTTMCLLSLFATPSLSRPEVMSNVGSLTSEESWTLNLLTRFWEAIAPEGAQLDYIESTLSNVVTFLDCVRVFSTRTSGFDSRSAVMNRVSILCSQITTTFLVTEPLPLPSPVEKRLCLMVFDLALIDPRSGLRPQGIAGNTLSNLLKVRQDHKRFDAFSQDLRVSASICFY